MSWYSERVEILRELFAALGAESHWDDDPHRLVHFMESTWLGTDHGAQHGKPWFGEQQAAAARPLLSRLGLTDRVPPPLPAYDEIVVMGASGGGLHRRLEFVRTSEVRARGLTVLAGLRPHERQVRDGGLSELLARSGRFAAAPGWAPPQMILHQHSLLVAASVDDFAAAAIAVPSETALAKLLLPKQWPEARVEEILVTEPHSVENELGQRPWTLMTYRSPGPIPTLRILNGAPVERPSLPDGTTRPARPTSISTFDEWLDVVPDGRENHDRAADMSVLAVVNQPHLGRVRLELLEYLDHVGRRDIRLDVAGCETLSDASIVLLLGEIPAWIRADWRATALTNR